MKKTKKLNLLKVTGAITILMAIYIIHKNISYRINITCLGCIIINYLYIMCPIKRKVKKGSGKNGK